jgi:hypothetical protein
MSQRAKILCLALLFASRPAVATTWSNAERPDPLAPGETCAVHEPMSYGSYIYHWPSKYDQVFWPLIDGHGIWHCAASGYTAFMGDVELAEGDRDRVRGWLAANRGAAGGIGAPEEKIRLLEGVSAQRDQPEAERITLLRVLAFLHDEREDFDAAARYRADALARIRAALAGDQEPIDRLEYLFVAAAYTKEAGEEGAAASARDALLAALAAVPPAREEDADDEGAAAERNEDGGDAEQLAGYAEYLRDLVPDLERIAPGGALAPEPAATDGDR